jgi:transcriptional antiterminator RfaH
MIAGTRWYVVQTRPHAENKAASHLTRQGFTTYMPRYLKRRRHARKVDTVSAPLFPRYIFVAVDTSSQRWRCIQSTVGVAHLIAQGDEPTAIADKIVEELKRREDDSGFIQVPPRPCFKPGQAIRVQDGVFSACLGLYEGMADVERVAVLIDLLGRKVRVVMDADLVAAA